MSAQRDLLENVKWRPVLVPKPSLKLHTHSINMRGLRRMEPDPYLEYLVKGEDREYMKMQEIFNVLPLYEELSLVLEQFMAKYGSEFDKDILKNTAALSLVPASHTFLDEMGAFTLTEKSTIPFADPSIYLQRYETKVADLRKIVASYPRGKNTGLPIIVSGANRFTNNVVNVINLIAASVFQEWMYDQDFPTFKANVDDTLKWMNEQFGYATSQVVFSRYQHIGKLVPVTFKDTHNQWFGSTNLFPRRRIINSTIKYIAMALKAAVKVMTEVDLSTPIFEQDRPRIIQRIRDCKAKGGVVVAIDQSRFDLRHGGDKMTYLYDKILTPRFKRMFGKVGEHVAYLSIIEASSTTLISTLEGVLAGDGRDILKSGESMTSRKGSYMNMVDDMTITKIVMNMSDEQVNEYYLKHQPSIILGDDLLKLFPTAEDADKYTRGMGEIGKQMGIGMDLEKPSKFLGQLVVNAGDPYGNSPDLSTYNGTQISGIDWIQPMGSIAQKAVFPERFKSERFPTFAAIIKFVVIPFHAIKSSDIAKNPAITDAYLTDVKQFYMAQAAARKKYGNTRFEYFQKTAEHFPTTRAGVAQLYADLLANPTKYGLDVNYDFDEILNALFKGLEFDVNWSVVGLELDQDLTGIKGTLKDVNDTLISEISPNAKSSEFIIKLIREANAAYKPDPSFIKYLYDTVIRYHKLLGMRYSPGLPIY